MVLSANGTASRTSSGSSSRAKALSSLMSDMATASFVSA